MKIFNFLIISFWLFSLCSCKEKKDTSGDIAAAVSPSQNSDPTYGREASRPYQKRENIATAVSPSHIFTVSPALRENKIITARPISTRTLSLKVTIKNAGKAAFKPILVRFDNPRYEVAFYLIANLLNITEVPASTIKKVSLNRLVNLLKTNFPDEAGELEKRALTDNNGYIKGAVIDWIKDLDPHGFKKFGGTKKLFSLLNKKSDNPKDQKLTKEATSLLTLDYLTGNWDRFSGGNIFMNKKGDGFILIDNSNAFETWSNIQKTRMEKQLDKIKTIPKELLQKLRVLKHKDINNAIAKEPSHKLSPILTKEEIQLLLKRRDHLLKKLIR